MKKFLENKIFRQSFLHEAVSQMYNIESYNMRFYKNSTWCIQVRMVQVTQQAILFWRSQGPGVSALYGEPSWVTKQILVGKFALRGARERQIFLTDVKSTIHALIKQQRTILVVRDGSLVTRRT